MQAFHIPGAAPLYTNTFLLISDAGHAVVIDPAADAQTYDKILKENNAQLTTILCTHGHYDHTGAVGELQAKWLETPVYLKVVVEKLTRTFYYSYDGQKWEKVGALENCIYLCDEGGRVVVYTCTENGLPDKRLLRTGIYVNLLPEADAVRLKQGFYVSGETALRAQLEDLGG